MRDRSRVGEVLRAARERRARGESSAVLAAHLQASLNEDMAWRIKTYDPQRISEVLAVREKAWRLHPDWRLGQLFEILDIDFFTYEDEVLSKLRKFIAEGDGKAT